MGKYLLILTSTYGDGDAPTNAIRFLQRIKLLKQDHQMNISVIGFGSKDYTNFCGFATEINRALQQQKWANMPIALHKVNDNSSEDFCIWIEKLISTYQLPLIATPNLYDIQNKNLHSFIIVDRHFSEEDQLFKICIENTSNCTFNSGDLLAIYPKINQEVRYYSISKVDGKMELIVRAYPNGLGSQFLKSNPLHQSFKARIIENIQFHLPNNMRPIVMIANGTGIAPFRGMIQQNNQKIPIHLFYGSRNYSVYEQFFKLEFDQYIQEDKLCNQYLAFSRDHPKQYITDIIFKEISLIIDVLKQGGTIMICGSINMQKDVLATVSIACKEFLHTEIESLLDNKQILSDCY